MDPISAIAGISTVCVRGAKILVGFYEYIHEIGDVPRYVDQLTSVLSAVNSGLQQLKVMITARSKDDLVQRWASDLKLMVVNCSETFSQIESMVEKAKIETKSSSKGQIVKCITWVWSEKKVNLLREQLERYKASIFLMLETLSGYDTHYILNYVQMLKNLGSSSG